MRMVITSLLCAVAAASLSGCFVPFDVSSRPLGLESGYVKGTTYITQKPLYRAEEGDQSGFSPPRTLYARRDWAEHYGYLGVLPAGTRIKNTGITIYHNPAANRIHYDVQGRILDGPFAGEKVGLNHISGGRYDQKRQHVIRTLDRECLQPELIKPASGAE